LFPSSSARTNHSISHFVPKKLGFGDEQSVYGHILKAIVNDLATYISSQLNTDKTNQNLFDSKRVASYARTNHSISHVVPKK
jgi:hypothetical protein